MRSNPRNVNRERRKAEQCKRQDKCFAPGSLYLRTTDPRST